MSTEPPVEINPPPDVDQVAEAVAINEVPDNMPDNITIPHGPAQWAALAVLIAGIIGAIGVGVVTVAGALPGGVSNGVGAALTGIGAALAAVSLGIYAAVRAFNGKLHEMKAERLKGDQ